MSSQLAYRLGDGAPVTIDSARAIWTAVAREVLEEVSRTSSVAHSELARQDDDVDVVGRDRGAECREEQE